MLNVDPKVGVRSLLKLSLEEARPLIRKLKREKSSKARTDHSANTWQLFDFSRIITRQNEGSLGLFYPKPEWDEPSLPLESAELKGKVTFPHLERNEMRFSDDVAKEWHPRLGVYHAPKVENEIVPEALLVPCLVADKKGNRIGNGGGYYDRYLSKHPARKSYGCIHSEFLLDEIPSTWLKPHDQKLQFIWTEKEFIKIGDNL